MATETIRVHGLPELMRKLDPSKIAGAPARNFLNKWAIATEREAKAGAPVWRGHLRRSLTHDVDGGTFPTSARVGTNAPHAPFMEYGTGLLSDGPGGGGGRHFPPPAALAPWAASKGLNPYQVALGIYRRGGLKPRRYLRNASESTEKRLPMWVSEMAREIESGASSGTR